MNKKLSWDKIKEFYVGHWVELTDFEWDWNKANPSWACVRHCSNDRGELLSLVRQDIEVENSVILYITSGQSLAGSPLSNGASPVTL